MKKTKADYIFAVGRRKTSVARVRLHKGKGENMVNDKKIEDYFPTATQRVNWIKPFKLTDTFEKFFVTAKVAGGGMEGQLEALVMGLSRALLKANSEVRTVLKKEGLLTRDGRKRQRRMVGTGGKARRQKQSPKR